PAHPPFPPRRSSDLPRRRQPSLVATITRSRRAGPSLVATIRVLGGPDPPSVATIPSRRREAHPPRLDRRRPPHPRRLPALLRLPDRKSTRLNSSHVS